MHKTSNTSRKSQWNESGSGRKKIKLHRGISLSLNTVLIFLIFCNFSVIHNGRFNFKHLLYNVEHLLWLHLSDPVLRLKITISCTYYCSAEWKISLHFSRMHKQENLKKKSVRALQQCDTRTYVSLTCEPASAAPSSSLSSSSLLSSSSADVDAFQSCFWCWSSLQIPNNAMHQSVKKATAPFTISTRVAFNNLNQLWTVASLWT